ncbi:MAG: Hsp20/alpha crystallin family protein [Chryseobacterium sp.]|uniref:Hsp20/alpha crystallin family protein n=1 Tax=Pedobacter agri TaxID=454586 RepID=A0A9X3I8P1_9SPHI|nr:Hsp20/alpha crystallin family protein [Pedobacter agri]MCX3263683.1 Hsp20/alpha crystallin family protein [Pedobacter agri]MDQ1141841.1 HSP20 family protein [Pedobacter agri]RZJ92572.1 MAG: Hsp20/alpha crystallin family protein [Chryseobacterium sp.]
MTLVKFNPEKKNSALLPGFNDIFESVLGDTFFTDRRTASVPAVNISESAEAYQIELAAPGLKKEDFKVSIEKDILSISSQRSEESSSESKTYNRREYSYSAFTRSFTLPESADADRIHASYTDGVLKMTLPKKEEAKAVSRQIEIS